MIAQKLLGQDLAAAAVAIDAAQVKGVLPLPLPSRRVTFPVVKNPANRNRSVSLTAEQFRYAARPLSSPTRPPPARPPAVSPNRTRPRPGPAAGQRPSRHRQWPDRTVWWVGVRIAPQPTTEVDRQWWSLGTRAVPRAGCRGVG
ncbi:hypothetical protein [Actinoplanes derwentensis]|uniref:hypothetical protein n=1 Tax=Actinoplanes derwentensis TaxID=113562 RepID=UPI001A3AABEC|nr:hypothetical protein [Actinoplanes derwentensis]GID81090.1 hypothetical protein Ade03nite_00140 [Actinoplanes derwentensis]